MKYYVVGIPSLGSKYILVFHESYSYHEARDRVRKVDGFDKVKIMPESMIKNIIGRPDDIDVGLNIEQIETGIRQLIMPLVARHGGRPRLEIFVGHENYEVEILMSERPVGLQTL